MKLCPDCPTDNAAPSRDQRDHVQDGRCITHHDLAQARPNAAPRKQPQREDSYELAEAYV